MKRDGWRRREKWTAARRRCWRVGMATLLGACGLFLLLVTLAAVAHAQRGNTHFADQYRGGTVGEKITAAQLDCTPNIPCVIVIDAQLAPMAEGTLPSPCAQCLWKDYRSAGVERVTPAGFLGEPCINVRSNCSGVKADGVTDDFAALQACLNANPGRRVCLGRTGAATSGGGGAETFSYYSSDGPLILSGNGQRIVGENQDKFTGGTNIKFAAGKSGILIPDTCYSCGVESLGVYSLSNGVAGSDVGIEARGGEPYIRGVDVNKFGSHGVYINGTSNVNPTYQPDMWEVSNSVFANNGGDGLFVNGTDANAGAAFGNNAWFNAGVGFHDAASYPNFWGWNHASGNGRGYKDANSVGSTWDTDYTEGNNTNPDQFGGTQGSIVRGGWRGKYCDLTVFGGNNANLDGTNCTSGAHPFTRTLLDLWNQRDASGGAWGRAGLTSDQDFEWGINDYQNNSKWAIRRAASDGSLKLWNYTRTTPNWQMWMLPGDARSLILRGSTSGGVATNYADGTGGLCEYGGTSAAKWCANPDGSTNHVGVAFSALGSPANGTAQYCTDCNATCTAGGGTGRTCFRENGVWTH